MSAVTPSSGNVKSEKPLAAGTRREVCACLPEGDTPGRLHAGRAKQLRQHGEARLSGSRGVRSDRAEQKKESIILLDCEVGWKGLEK